MWFNQYWSADMWGWKFRARSNEVLSLDLHCIPVKGILSVFWNLITAKNMFVFVCVLIHLWKLEKCFCCTQIKLKKSWLSLSPFNLQPTGTIGLRGSDHERQQRFQGGGGGGFPNTGLNDRLVWHFPLFTCPFSSCQPPAHPTEEPWRQGFRISQSISKGWAICSSSSSNGTKDLVPSWGRNWGGK